MAAPDGPVPHTVPPDVLGSARAAAPFVNPGLMTAGAGAADEQAGTGDAPRLLLVEDSADDAELTLHALARSGLAAGAKWVRDGAEAIEWLAAGGTDSVKLVLLDLKMPRMDGYDVLRQMKAMPSASGIPVIVMVSAHDTPEIERCLALGADAYLVKPLEGDALREAMRKLAVKLE